MLRTFVAIVTLVCAASPAAAQSDFWTGVTTDAISQAVGQSVNGQVIPRETACMQGLIPPLHERWMTQIRDGSGATMGRYFRSAAASESSDVESLFSRLRRTRTWERISDGSAGDLEAINDPLARASGASLGQPEQFFLAGDEQSAAGIWFVRDAEGSLLGHYRAVFRRERSVWRLLHLDVGEGSEPPAPLTAYCHVPGDVPTSPLVESAEDTRPEEAPAAPAEPIETPPSP